MLNKDLYQLYEESEPSKAGFMKRLKSLWDAKHPEIQITAKNLNEQAKRIAKKQLIYMGCGQWRSKGCGGPRSDFHVGPLPHTLKGGPVLTPESY